MQRFFTLTPSTVFQFIKQILKGIFHFSWNEFVGCWSALINNPVGLYQLKVNSRNIRAKSEICSKLIMSPERRQSRSGVFINFEHILTLCSSVSIVKFEHENAGWESFKL